MYKDQITLKPNYALKGTSVETLDSSEPSSGASVPYLGCQALKALKLLTPELESEICRLIESSEPSTFFSPDELAIAKEFNALLIDNTVAAYMLRRNGEVIFKEKDDIEIKHDNASFLMALSYAAMKYPSVKGFISNFQHGSVQCDLCSGSGIYNQAKCVVCQGRGWGLASA